MSEDESLENSLTEYRGQLATVEAALLSSENDASLLELKENLQEVIKLLEDQLLSIKKAALLTQVEEPREDRVPVKEKTEYELFQEEIAALSDNKEAKVSPKDVTPDLEQCVSELEGKRCRAPHQKEWGQLAYHNALIIGTDAEGAQNIDDIDVCVMFCNPTCESMKPCSFFLDGRCKFSNDLCRFSHGYVVKLSDVQEFKEPDYSLLQRDTFCMAKYHDDLWYNAQVLECLDDNKLKVKYSQYNEDLILSVEDVLPLDNQPTYSDSDVSRDGMSDSSSEDSSSCDDIPQVVWIPSNDIALGDWEKYTKGFGSKLMEQMGYIKGQGLGRNGEGRVDPIEAVILPQGKSLDKCMELREIRESRNTETVEKRLKQKKNREAKTIANGYQHKVRQERKKSVFDFLNSKLKGKHENHKENIHSGLQLQPRQPEKLRTQSVRGLNVQSLQVGEDINKAQKELKRLQEALTRNKDRDRVIKSQLEGKICTQQQLIQSLQSQEQMISREQTCRKDKKKLTVF